MLAQESTTHPGICKTPGVLGGEACIGNRRIAVWMLVRWRQLGRSDAELLADFEPPLTEEELRCSWVYYDSHRDEIDAAIRRNEED